MCNCGGAKRTNSSIIYRQPVKSNSNSSNTQLSNIWKRIINNDGIAKQELIKLYLLKYPNNRRLVLDTSIQNLHKLYIQLINT